MTLTVILSWIIAAQAALILALLGWGGYHKHEHQGRKLDLEDARTALFKTQRHVTDLNVRDAQHQRDYRELQEKLGTELAHAEHWRHAAAEK